MLIVKVTTLRKQKGREEESRLLDCCKPIDYSKWRRKNKWRPSEREQGIPFVVSRRNTIQNRFCIENGENLQELIYSFCIFILKRFGNVQRLHACARQFVLFYSQTNAVHENVCCTKYQASSKRVTYLQIVEKKLFFLFVYYLFYLFICFFIQQRWCLGV